MPRRKPPPPTPPEPFPHTLYRYGCVGPDGTLEHDAWALLGARILWNPPGPHRGHYHARHARVMAVLRENPDTYSPLMRRAIWEELVRDELQKRRVAAQQPAAPLHLNFDGKVFRLPKTRKPPHPRGAPFLQVSTRVSQVIGLTVETPRTELLDALGLLAGRTKGPGRPRKSQ